MDRLESLGNALSNITMYDIKSMYNQVRSPTICLRLCLRRRLFSWGSHGVLGEERRAQRQRDGGQGAGGDERRGMVRSIFVRDRMLGC